MDEAEAKKAKILSRTQMILERTKAKLAQEKEGKKAQRQRGKRSGWISFVNMSILFKLLFSIYFKSQTDVGCILFSIVLIV